MTNVVFQHLLILKKNFPFHYKPCSSIVQALIFYAAGPGFRVGWYFEVKSQVVHAFDHGLSLSIVILLIGMLNAVPTCEIHDRYFNVEGLSKDHSTFCLGLNRKSPHYQLRTIKSTHSSELLSCAPNSSQVWQHVALSQRLT